MSEMLLTNCWVTEWRRNGVLLLICGLEKFDRWDLGIPRTTTSGGESDWKKDEVLLLLCEELCRSTFGISEVVKKPNSSIASATQLRIGSHIAIRMEGIVFSTTVCFCSHWMKVRITMMKVLRFVPSHWTELGFVPSNRRKRHELFATVLYTIDPTTQHRIIITRFQRNGRGTIHKPATKILLT